MLELSDDQRRFLLANAAGIGLALQYRFVPKTFRDKYHMINGILMIYYCFGSDANSLVLFSLISYLICRYSPWNNVHHLSLISSLAFLSYTHLTRQILDYGGYVLDISGPFMIAVQKITSLGFCLHDGGYLKTKEAIDDSSTDNNNNETDDDIPFSNQNIMSPVSPETSPDVFRLDKKLLISDRKTIKPNSDRLEIIMQERKKYSIRDRPSMGEFFGYFFHFPSVMCGPIVYFTDYRQFVRQDDCNEKHPGKWPSVLRKLTVSVICALLHLSLNSMFDVKYLRTSEFQFGLPFIIRFGYIVVLTVLSRLKYYFAWHLGEVLSNISGLGFAGYDHTGKSNWNLLSNMDLWKFETCLSMRDAILAWNKTTQTWLRRTAYDRVPRRYSVLATYTLSAVWHGFYPGYYMTFLTGALFTIASRQGRRIFRPLFQKGTILPRFYDLITFILTRLAIAYTAFPFVILDFQGSFLIYKSLYFSLHLLAIIGLLLGFVIRRSVK